MHREFPVVYNRKHIMKTKTSKTIAAKAIDMAFAQVQIESGITPMDLFMVGVGYTGVGLYLVNTTWMPGSLKVLGGFIVATGIIAMILIAGKLEK